MESSLVSTCYVVSFLGKVEPVVYLEVPQVSADEKVYEFPNPFWAVAFIQFWTGLRPAVSGTGVRLNKNVVGI